MRVFRWMCMLNATWVLVSTTVLAAQPERTAKTPAALPAPSLDEQIGQMLLVGFQGKRLTSDSAFVKDIRSGNIGNVILFDYDVTSRSFDRNIESPGQLRALLDTLRRAARNHVAPLIISIDQEGGRVNRLKDTYGFPPSVSQQYLGTLRNTDSTRFYAARTASTLAKYGINLNFAPLVDVNSNPDNPVIGKIERSFSADPNIVAEQAAIVIQEHRKRGVLTTVKHFPGHGSSKADSHKGFVDVTDSWKPEELIPYEKLIRKGLVDMIMTAHIFNAHLDTVPATLSKRVITGMLRDSLGYKGVVISDDMQMKAIADHYGLEQALQLCINAGVDIVCFGNNVSFDPAIAGKVHTILKSLVESGKISRARIEESYQRILALKRKLRRER